MYDQPEPAESLDPINIPKTASATVTEKTSWGPTKVHNFYTHNHEMGITHFDELDPYSTTDLLTLLHLPKYSFTSSSNTPFLSPTSSYGSSAFNFPNMMVDNPSGSGSGPGSGSGSSTISHDPLFHLNFPLSQLMFEQSFTDGFNAEREIEVCGNMNGNGNGNGNSSFLFDDGEGNTNTINGYYDDDNHPLFHDFNGVFEFGKDDKKVGKLPKSSFTEKQRRKNFSDKYQDLRSLIPNQTKDDRASIILDAINHIKELKRTLGELKILVAKKRMNNLKPEQQNPGGEPDPEELLNGLTAMQLRNSWVHRKCKDIELDVRILDDEISIKIVQRKKINCLLYVSRILDEFGLDLCHVVGALVGDYYTFLFNSKICEGSSIYASEIANKVIDVVERQHVVVAAAAVAPTSTF